jgi:hypothetical protein
MAGFCALPAGPEQGDFRRNETGARLLPWLDSAETLINLPKMLARLQSHPSLQASYRGRAD